MNKSRNQFKPIHLVIVIVLFLVYGFSIVYVSALLRKTTEPQVVESVVYFSPLPDETPQAQEDKLKRALSQSLRQSQLDTKYQEDVLEQKKDARKNEVKLEEFKKDHDELLLERQLNITH
ncbi:MAG: hypothetical protein V1863_05440 [Candidatus Omnitrophota bacterium]